MATVNWSGPFTSDQTALAADENNITGAVTVNAGCLFTIEPGARMIFQGNYYFTVNTGALVSDGTSAERIGWVSSDGDPAVGGHLKFTGLQGASSIAYNYWRDTGWTSGFAGSLYFESVSGVDYTNITFDYLTFDPVEDGSGGAASASCGILMRSAVVSQDESVAFSNIVFLGSSGFVGDSSVSAAGTKVTINGLVFRSGRKMSPGDSAKSLLTTPPIDVTDGVFLGMSSVDMTGNTGTAWSNQYKFTDCIFGRTRNSGQRASTPRACLFLLNNSTSRVLGVDLTRCVMIGNFHAMTIQGPGSGTSRQNNVLDSDFLWCENDPIYYTNSGTPEGGAHDGNAFYGIGKYHTALETALGNIYRNKPSSLTPANIRTASLNKPFTFSDGLGGGAQSFVLTSPDANSIRVQAELDTGPDATQGRMWWKIWIKPDGGDWSVVNIGGDLSVLGSGEWREILATGDGSGTSMGGTWVSSIDKTIGGLQADTQYSVRVETLIDPTMVGYGAVSEVDTVTTDPAAAGGGASIIGGSIVRGAA